MLFVELAKCDKGGFTKYLVYVRKHLTEGVDSFSRLENVAHKKN